MSHRAAPIDRIPARFRFVIGFGAALALTACAKDAIVPTIGTQGIPMNQATTQHANGSFDVTLQALPAYNDAPDTKLGRRSLDKHFHGDLEAVSKGEMLSAMTDVKGSAGYVAIEQVSGRLGGRSGSFVLQHNATMTRGEPSLNIIVVPDSGTGELAGLKGQMTINIIEGKHFYALDYSLPEGS